MAAGRDRAACRSIRNSRRRRRHRRSRRGATKPARQGLVGADAAQSRSYPTAPGFIAALAASDRRGAGPRRRRRSPVRLLLSAHGLPLKIVRAGDPYPAGDRKNRRGGRRGARPAGSRLAGLLSEPGRSAGLARAVGRRGDSPRRRATGCAVVIAPISFVSEHSETLVELDRDYRRLAEACGVPAYYRVPTVGTDPRFIAALAELVRADGPHERLARRGLSLAQGVAHRRGDRLDGGAALSAAALRLSRRCAGRVGPGGDCSRSWSGACCAASCCRRSVMTYGVRRRCWRRLRAWSTGGKAGSGRNWRWSLALTVFHLLLARWRREFAAGPNRASGAVLPHGQ